MPEVRIQIGGREFDVACQDGEEHFLRAAARLLDTEAAALLGQIGRVPEARMLLMAGLMLADKTAGLEDQLRATEARLRDAEAAYDRARNGSPRLADLAAGAGQAPDLARLAALVDEAETLADYADGRTAA